jgi:Lrp/AsnC family leucine-responsive transcriptional regulator
VRPRRHPGVHHLDLDRSLLDGGTPVLCDLSVTPGAVERVREGIEGAAETEYVFTTADAHVVFRATLAERDVPELLDAATDIDSINEYDVSLVSSTAWTPQVGDVAFAPECVECGNTVSEEGTTTRLDGDLYHFCCPSCESRFTERYESLREGASG